MQEKENKSSEISGMTFTDTWQSELQTIIDSVPAMIFYKDTGNRFLKVNRAFCELMGIQKEKLEGKSLFDIFPEKEANAYSKDDLEVISTGKAKTGIVESMHTKNGDLWIKTDKIPCRDPAGEIIGIIGFAVDITQSLLSEGYLKKFNRVLRAISGSNRALTHAKSEHDYLQSSCEIICKECGYMLAWIGLAENDVKKTVRPVASAGFEEGYLKKLNITWADSERGRGPTGMAIRTGKITICRDMLNDPDFKPWRAEAVKRGYASSIAIPLQSGNDVLGALMLYSAETDPFSKDEIALLMEMGFDLYYGIELIRARERNLAAEIELKRAAMAKSDFLGNMSHELRTPLNSINGFSEVLYDGTFGPLNDKQKNYINNILISGQHLLLLINQILDLSKVESGKMNLVLSNLPMKNLLNEISLLLADTIDKKKLQALLEIAEDLPNIEADELKVKEIVYNLLSNAVKFTPAGGKIGIRAKKADSEIEVTVWDTGVGIASENMEKIFEGFFRVDTPYSRVTEGTGLGLPLSKKLVELHGGKLSVESGGLNKGTSVRFTLPIISSQVV